MRTGTCCAGAARSFRRRRPNICIVAHPGRRTITKRRVIGGRQMLVRFDQGNTGAIDAQTEAGADRSSDRAVPDRRRVDHLRLRLRGAHPAGGRDHRGPAGSVAAGDRRGRQAIWRRYRDAGRDRCQAELRRGDQALLGPAKLEGACAAPSRSRPMASTFWS